MRRRFSIISTTFVVGLVGLALAPWILGAAHSWAAFWCGMTSIVLDFAVMFRGAQLQNWTGRGKRYVFSPTMFGFVLFWITIASLSSVF